MIASTTKSAAASASRSTVVVSRPSVASRSTADSLPFSTNLASDLSMPPRARSSAGCDTSCSVTEKPDCAKTCAIPDPMVPEPMTAMWRRGMVSHYRRTTNDERRTTSDE
jgi:hypothetical protein